jgi:hypothetical protein
MNLSTQPISVDAMGTGTLDTFDAVSIDTTFFTTDRTEGKRTSRVAREKEHLRVTVLDNGRGVSSVQGRA